MNSDSTPADANLARNDATTRGFKDHLYIVREIQRGDPTAPTIDEARPAAPVESLCGQQSYGGFERVNDHSTLADEGVCANCLRIARQRDILNDGDEP